MQSHSSLRVTVTSILIYDACLAIAIIKKLCVSGEFIMLESSNVSIIQEIIIQFESKITLSTNFKGAGFDAFARILGL